MTEERILDFLDGRLDSEAEEELLHTLAVSPERRKLLKEHMRIRELIGDMSKEDRYTVPPIVTSQLFDKLAALGLSSGAAVPPIASTVSRMMQFAAPAATVVGGAALIENASPGIGFRLSSVVVTGIVSFILGISLFYFLSNGTANEPKFAFRPPPLAPLTADASLNVAEAMPPVHMASMPISHSGLSDMVLPDLGAASSFGNIADASYEEPPTETYTDDPPGLHFVKMRLPVKEASNKIPHGSSIRTFPESYVGRGAYDQIGTISMSYGGGKVPRSSDGVVSSLAELKFTWRLYNWFIGRASLGEFMPYEREAINPVQSPGGKSLISAPSQQKMVAVIGAEAGITLAPIHIPLELSAGFMADGAGNMYPRYGAMLRISPFGKFSVGLGAEYTVYTHDVSQSISGMQARWKSYSPIASPGTPMTEKSGFFGPSLELGYQF